MTGDWAAIVAPRLTTVRRTPLRATFIERPHRFAARCVLRGGIEVAAHVPNPGRLTGVLAPGCQLLIDGPYPETRALAYTMVAAKAGGVLIGTNTLYANRVFPALVSHDLFPEFQGSSIRAEVAHGRSRFDFQVGGMMVEVKSVTLASGVRRAVPRRRQRPRGPSLRRTGRACCRPAIPPPLSSWRSGAMWSQWRRKTRIDPAFGVALRGASKAGVLMMACALDITPQGAARARRVPVLLGDA